MKANNFIKAIAALLLIGTFASCTKEQQGGNEVSVSENDHTMYVNVAISSSNGLGTKAYDPTTDPDFDKGIPKESEVKIVYFVFYDADGQVVGDIVQVPVGELETETELDGGNVRKTYVSVVPVTMLKGQSTPTQVMCYVNPVTPSELQNPISYIETVTRERVMTAEGNFPMSNSVYYNGQNVVRAAQIGEGQLFESKDAAEDALTKDENAARVNIYVERYAAKLNFSLAATTSDNSYDAGEGEETFTLKFNAKKWALNAQGKTAFITKSFRKSGTQGIILDENYTYDEANTIIDKNNTWQWNSSAMHRSYWACSPSYYTDAYPEVAGDVEDDFAVKYWTLDEVLNTPGVGFTPTAAGEAQYFRETTVGTVGFNGTNPAAAVPSVILVGDYTVNNGTADLPEGTTFYTYQKNAEGHANIYFETAASSDNAASAVAGGTSMLRRFINQITILAKKDATTGVITVFDPSNNAVDLRYLASVLEVTRPSDEVIAASTDKLAARRMTVQLKDGYTHPDGYTLVFANGSGYTEVTADNINDLNVLLIANVGFADKYNAGAAYFNIPVKHLGWYRAGNPNAAATTVDWSKVRVGDFGVVRNHSYDLDVTSITGLGTGIADPNDPIVPPVDTKDYYVGYRLNILNWALVPTQEVEL